MKFLKDIDYKISYAFLFIISALSIINILCIDDSNTLSTNYLQKQPEINSKTTKQFLLEEFANILLNVSKADKNKTYTTENLLKDLIGSLFEIKNHLTNETKTNPPSSSNSQIKNLDGLEKFIEQLTPQAKEYIISKLQK